MKRKFAVIQIPDRAWIFRATNGSENSSHFQLLLCYWENKTVYEPTW